ncbi:MAG: AAA family ATPase [Candidatus Woesearchaeota archaeon]
MDVAVRKEEVSTSSLYEENKKLRETVYSLKKEMDAFKEPPLLLCELVKHLGNKAVIKLPNGNNFLVNIAPSVSNKVKQADRVLVEQKSLAIVDRFESMKEFNVENFVIIDKPDMSWSNIGGLAEQAREIYEVIELPLKKPELFKKIGIHPPKGILLYGPSGTGKTILAKAVAASTNSTFIEIVGGELVQKFIGEGSKLVKDIFKLARERGPSIIFIDELDSIAAERLDIGTSGEREVQRTFMQLLSEIDGFDHLGNVKIIGATNRIDILDNAILRPGRLDRLIHIPLPNWEGRTEILKIHSRDMNLIEVDLSKIAELTEGFSGADLKSVCTEAGYFVMREKRTETELKDFLRAIDKVKQQEEKDLTHRDMFG